MDIYVYADWEKLEGRPLLMGTLTAVHTKGRQIMSFASDNSLNFDLAREVAKYFRLNNTKADEIITGTKKVVEEWQKVATKHKIPSKEQEMMASAFEN